MRNFLLGLLLALSISTIAGQLREDGALILDKAEAEQLNIQWYQLNKDFSICIGNVDQLRHELETIKKDKCT